MTPELLIREWLSLRYWLIRCVLPSSVILVFILALLRVVTREPSNLNHNALLVGFFAVYFILVRGGHILMIRSMHFDLMHKYEAAYREKLAYLPIGQMKRRNIGFTLAKIKRELIDTRKAKPRNKQ